MRPNLIDIIRRLPSRMFIEVEGDEPWLAACIVLPDEIGEFERFLSVFWRIYSDRGTMTIEAGGKRYRLALEDETWRTVINDEFQHTLEEAHGHESERQKDAR